MKIYSKTKNKVFVAGLVILFSFVLGLFLGLKYQKRQTNSVVGQKDSPACLVIKPEVDADLSGVFINSLFGYRLEIPKNWGAKTENQFEEGVSLEIYSPDLFIYNEGYGSPVVGAHISVYVKKSSQASFDEYLKDLRESDKSMYVNPRYVYVDGIKAIQYENGWEGWGTVTSFVKNNKEYSIVMTYNYDQKNTQKYIDEYNSLIKTFKLVISENSK